MSLFNNLMSKIFGKDTPDPTPIPGAMGDILASMGIHELKPTQPRVPYGALVTNSANLVIVPGTEQAAVNRRGEPMMARAKGGREYRVMENYAVSRKQMRAMMQEQKRRAEGRWYSGEPQASIDARANA